MAGKQEILEPEKNLIVASHNGWRTFGIVIITIIITLGVSYWLFTRYLFPAAFTPVQLSQKEQLQLDKKIRRLSVDVTAINQSSLEPQAYSEVGSRREIRFSEKELNALLANNTNLASKLAIDLSENLASARLLVHLDPDLPVLGGNTLMVNAGLELSPGNGKPRVILKGVSIWGVPLPNAWLGNMKNANLIEEFGQAGGFWQSIKEGVEVIEVKEGELIIKLKK